MLLTPEIIAILMIDSIFLFFAIFIFCISIAIVLRWDINSTSKQQYQLEKKGCEKPIWVTEFGYTTKGFDSEQSVSESDQLDFTIKQTLVAIGKGAERVENFDGADFEFTEKNRKKYENCK